MVLSLVAAVAPTQSSENRRPNPASRSTASWLWRFEKSTMQESCPAWGGSTRVGTTRSAPATLKSRRRAIGVANTSSCSCAQRGRRRRDTSRLHCSRSSAASGRPHAPRHQRSVPSIAAAVAVVPASVRRGTRVGMASTMSTNLSERAAIVTGAASGIGRAVAEHLVSGGAQVLAVDLDPDPDGPGEPFAADLTDASANEEAVAFAIERFGHLDTVVPNAGFQHVAPVAEFPTDRWEALLALLLTSPFLLAKYGWEQLAGSEDGRFVCIASVHGLVASPYKAGYVSAKHGVLGLVKVLALEGAESGVTASAVCPGYVRTPLVEKQIADQAKAHGVGEERVIEDIILAPHAVKQLIEPAEVGEVVAFLLGPAGRAFNGAP